MYTVQTSHTHLLISPPPFQGKKPLHPDRNAGEILVNGRRDILLIDRVGICRQAAPA